MFKINRLYLISAVLLIASVNNAQARELSYSSFSFDYTTFTDSSFDDDLDGDGIGFAASLPISDNLAFTASYSNIESDPYFGITIQQTAILFGFIAHTPISETTDLFGGFGIMNVDAELSDGFTTISDDDSGNAFSVGMRSLVNDQMEIRIGINRTDVFDNASNSTGIGATIYSSDTTAFTIDFITGDDVDSWSFGVRIEI